MNLSPVQTAFYWSSIHRDVTDYIRECTTCQTIKYNTHPPHGLLHPIPFPNNIWDEIAMDFITHLPLSQSFIAILVIVDRLSEYAHFIPLPPHITAPKVATIFSKDYCHLHGFPYAIISDRDLLFMSNFWIELLKLSGTTLKHTTAYHPQSDSQSEVTNRALEQYLHSFCSDHPCRWASILHWAEFWYNIAHHSSVGISSFRAVYGRDPPSLTDYLHVLATLDSVHRKLLDCREILTQLHHNLLTAEQRMKKSADKHRKDIRVNSGRAGAER